jgi:aspergillopepsin I
MKTVGTLLSGLAVVGLTAAAPAPNLADAADCGSFSVPVARNAAYKAHGPLALAKVYHKYGKTLPDDLAAAVARFRSSQRKARRATGSVSNAPEQYDSEYISGVQIGTPAQTLPLDFDTGSSDLWVFSTETSSREVDGQTLYSPSKSSSAQKLQGESWKISYGDGSSSSGDVYSDVVSIGGLSVKGQAVESATTVSSTFTEDTGSSGLLGLGFSNINTVSPNQQKTFFANAQSSLDKPVFTANLKHGAGKCLLS